MYKTQKSVFKFYAKRWNNVCVMCHYFKVWQVIWTYLTLKGYKSFNMEYKFKQCLPLCKKLLFIQIQWHWLYKEAKGQFNMSVFICRILYFYCFFFPWKLSKTSSTGHFYGAILSKYFLCKLVWFQCLCMTPVFYLYSITPQWHYNGEHTFW